MSSFSIFFFHSGLFQNAAKENTKNSDNIGHMAKATNRSTNWSACNPLVGMVALSMATYKRVPKGDRTNDHFLYMVSLKCRHEKMKHNHCDILARADGISYSGLPSRSYTHTHSLHCSLFRSFKRKRDTPASAGRTERIQKKEAKKNDAKKTQ